MIPSGVDGCLSQHEQSFRRERADKTFGQHVPGKHGGISSACRPFKDFCRQTKTKLHILTSSQISRPSGTRIFGPPPDISHRRATTNCSERVLYFHNPGRPPRIINQTRSCGLFHADGLQIVVWLKTLCLPSRVIPIRPSALL